MKQFFISFSLIFSVGSILAGAVLLYPKILHNYASISIQGGFETVKKKETEKTREELIKEALDNSSRIKALYMTADVAQDQGVGATRLRNHIIKLAEETEINGLVIDVKEVCGPDYSEKYLKSLLVELKEKNIWSIARIVVFKDASQIEAHPEWYLTRKNYKEVGIECFRKRYLKLAHPEGIKPDVVFWQDKRGGYWLDPASQGARDYIVDLSKKMIDLGFDELQFDYIRFPSDGDVENAVYPAWDGKNPKYLVMKEFFEYLNSSLKKYKPDIILSADMFGYTSILAGDVGIGQRLEDIGDNFDYISFMVYPSHYYSGFYLDEDKIRGLPAVSLNRNQAREHPEIIVARSMFVARDFLDGRLTSTSTVATSSLVYDHSTTTVSKSRARLRPWLEDFFHEQDQAAGRPYGLEKVRLQIEAAENSDNHGWLLWNAANVYSEGALKKEPE